MDDAMSKQAEASKPDQRWAWVLVIGLMIVAALGAALFITYSSKLPYISRNHEAWASFGSIMSAYITLAGFVLTIATLLFLNGQNQSQQQFIKWQTETLGFEQYISHRKLFIERISELQTVMGNKVVFHNPELLYNSIFPDNRPTHKLQLSVPPKFSDTEDNLLGRLGSRLSQLDRMLDKPQWQHQEVHQLQDLLLMIWSDLQIKWIGEESEGDLIYDRQNTGINIYSLSEFTARAKLIYNSFLFYTGNPEFKGLDKGSSRFVKEALMAFYIPRRYPKHTLTALKSTPSFHIIEQLYFEIESLRGEDQNWILPQTWRTLEQGFSNREKAASFTENDTILNLRALAMQEVTLALDSYPEGHELNSRLHQCWEKVDSLVANYYPKNPL